MKKQSMKKQAMVVGAGGVMVRGLGFLMRLMVSRLLGAEALGVMELASSAHMLALTPAASGLPGAVSRLTARAAEKDRPRILMAGRQLAFRMGIGLSALMLLLSPVMARLLGDERTLPSLILLSPSVVFIALSSVHDGYFYGCGQAWPPTLSELGEQIIRFLVVVPLLMGAGRLALCWRAAIPALSTVLGEGAGLIIVMAMARGAAMQGKEENLSPLRRQMVRLSLPLMLSRLSHTGLRSLCSVVIPLRLAAAGLDQAESLSRMGMLNGMVMPLMFLPGLFAGAIATVGGPAMAGCKQKSAEKRMFLRLMGPAVLIGVGGSLFVYLAAPLAARYFYRLPELAPLIRALCPMAAVLSMQQVAGGMMTGLGLQKKALLASLLGAAATLLCTWQWAANPALHIYGAGYASMAGHGLGLFATAIMLGGRVFGHSE